MFNVQAQVRLGATKIKTLAADTGFVKFATKDSLTTVNLDSVRAIKRDTLPYQISTDAPEFPIKYSAQDSIFYDLENEKLFLYGDAKIAYDDMSLKADYINIDMKTHMISAKSKSDSLTRSKGMPHFEQADKVYDARLMKYNYETKRGKIYDIITKEDEGYIHSEAIKKTEGEEYLGYKSKYTTCSNYDPHFYILATRMKVIPNKLIVSGPANLYIEDIPTPLFIPFGIFPISKGQRSGVLLPEPGNDGSRGFFIRNGGYYFGLGQHFDLSLTGDLYSYGSYALRTNSNYNNRYHYNGNFSLNYGRNKTGDEQEKNFTVRKDFLLQWNHRQDSKARPNSTFSASVKAGTSTYNKNNEYDFESYLNNSYNSSINYTKTFPGKPFNFSVSAGHDQNTYTHQVNITAPSVSFNVSRIAPFERKGGSTEKKWYENIGFSYTMNALNKLNSYDSIIFKKTKMTDFKNGVKHSIPISTNFKLAKYFILQPVVAYDERWYFRTLQLSRNAKDSVITTYHNGFASERELQASINLQTTVYGMLQFKKGKIKALRHVLYPRMGMAWHPDYGSAFWGYYKTLEADSTGANSRPYSIFENAVNGSILQPGKYAALTFGVNNDFEMKVYSKRDTVSHIKKIPLLRQLNISSSYNFAADSMRLLPFAISTNTQLMNKINLNASTTLDPYALNSKGQRTKEYALKAENKLGHFNGTRISIGTSLQSKQQPQSFGRKNNSFHKPAGFEDNTISIPYSLRVDYSLSINKVYYIDSKTFQLLDSLSYSQSVGGSIDFNPTEKWSVRINTGYDFKQHKLGSSQIVIGRDLHCWQFNLDVQPGRFYGVTINVKAQVLNDLKLSQRRQNPNTLTGF